MQKYREKLAKLVFIDSWSKEDECRRNDHYCRWSRHDGVCELNGVHLCKLKRCTYDWNVALKKADQIISALQPAIEEARKEEREGIGKEIISIFNYKETDWGDIHSLAKALTQGDRGGG